MKENVTNKGERIEKIISEAEIKTRVKELGEEITKAYEGKEVTVVGILRGASLFMADLVREIKLPSVKIDFLSCSSYGNSTTSSGEVKIEKDLSETVGGKNILIVEDIVDSGRTISYIMNYLKDRKAASVRLCALFDKDERREFDVKSDWIGFDIPDKFIVGYGLDYAQKYRNLPYIGELFLDEEE